MAASAACGLAWLGASAGAALGAGASAAADAHAAADSHAAADAHAAIESVDFRASKGCPDRAWMEARLREADVPDLLRLARARLAIEVSGNPGRDFEGTASLETAA